MAESATMTPGRSRFGVSLPLLFGLLVYAQVLSKAGAVLHDPDTYWHIAVGRWIIGHGAVPDHDVFSFSMPGAPFIPPEWLAEVLIAWLYDHFGWAALVATTAFCLAAALALLLRLLLRGLEPVHATIATALAWILALTHALARPHIFALPILIWWIAALVAARSEDRAPSIWLAALMILWANLHSSYMFGLGVAALLAGEAVILAPDWRARRLAARGWALFGILSIGAALITPFGVEGLMLPFTLVRMSYSLAVITEWRSPDFQQYQPLELWIMFVLFAALSRGWRLPPIRVGIVVLLLHMALQHGRYAELLGFVAPLLLAPALAPQLKARPGGAAVPLIDRGIAELAKPASALGIACAAALVLALSAAALPRAAPEKDWTPAAALAAVAERHVEGRVLNDYNFGGYLIFSGIKPFIDGRYFYGDAFIKRYVEATQAVTNELPQLLSEYGITWTLLPPDRPAVVLLDRLPGWRRLYADDVAVVHVREDQAAR
jgi:hypothetical protein